MQLQETKRERNPMTRYFRVMLGKGSAHAVECFGGGFIGVDFDLAIDLTNKLPENVRDFNSEFISIYQDRHPAKNKIAAGLACGMTWTLSKGMQIGDVIIAPTGDGNFRFGEISGNYQYAKDQILFHRRQVNWSGLILNKEVFSEQLRRSIGSIGTISEVTQHADEISKLLSGGVIVGGSPISDPTVEEPSVFVLEKYLEDFLVSNWESTELGKIYDIYRDENGTGQQYQTDSGRIDILAVSKDGKELLVVELKKGRASDSVVGQITRYMGYVTTELAGPGQNVKGVIVALEDDQRLRHSLVIVPGIDFYRYEVSFKLTKV
jgi:restriction system protein